MATQARDATSASLASTEAQIETERAHFADTYAAIDAEKARVAGVEEQASRDQTTLETRQVSCWPCAQQYVGKSQSCMVAGGA